VVKNFLFKDRNGQTPLPSELQKGLKPNHIQTIGELDEYEEQNIVEGLSWLKNCEGKYSSYDFWLKLHKKLFGDVWKWAGVVRKHELNNPDFHLPHQIWPSLKQLENDINYWLKKKAFSHKEIAARFHERIETIHPFTNGNGRFGRILVEFFCEKKSILIPTWGAFLKSDPEARRQAYITALECARRKTDYSLLIKFMFS